MSQSSQILVRPIISEKSYAGMQIGKYTFRVRPDANKVEIRDAVEKTFEVEVTSVRTMRVRGKLRRVVRGQQGRTPAWKKAVVTLRGGQRIDKLFGQL